MSKLWVEVPRVAGTHGGKGVSVVEAGGADEDGPLDPLALALSVPGNVIEGSSRFQQFFFM